jgi:hypothetical protein
MYDDIADCQLSPLGFPTRFVIDREREAAYLPIIVGLGISARREANAREDCKKSHSFQKLSSERSKSHGFIFSKNALQKAGRSRLAADLWQRPNRKHKRVIETGRRGLTEDSRGGLRFAPST